ncbi:bifunctional phosphoribosylaminoimidazolecarboxamide formyltransferase/IMP cyclohydrolase [Flavitalea sp. BT771]|uniref:bifunctional phosphoribosylaminoimidazolecarboxamide formyltransferase/IMP cyclohydrolase n=1 Tax=Flavitalea sp. BT771 TaxID=3063329 RepID=UPI0026E139CD|nr:bifunctional phosphoribosylaminoimidazolecarboxamide formyltransferase/IMP cyclohydrolase [Flavitalea sp. BT771]MDO6433775.1 bifunctional phosphoribosylaminoimidazolecarboxamide formyltransferase/IMP cyclohydrolase [Flavitalea sp. BT771]MDV6222320.1 bifunctional phosphoribosylaminoimidazolecarboxamide formyltransferase/IMP cyclohydrolase [Flavitalea sp. BT771]
MNKKIKSALISVFYKNGLDSIVKKLHQEGVIIYSTGGTQQFIESLGLPCTPVESLTSYPSILGGRVKTLHPSVFGGILGRRDRPTDLEEMARYHIPEIDLVIVDLYPFEETVASTSDDEAIIEKIDVGGPSMIRGAAKNHKDVVVIASKKEYAYLEQLLDDQKGTTTLEQRRMLAAKAFEVCAHYDVVIAQYFISPAAVSSQGAASSAPAQEPDYFLESVASPKSLRYGENPHQSARFFGNLSALFDQLNGKELSYNNLVDVDAAVQLIQEFDGTQGAVFAIIKHTNVCGISIRPSLKQAWDAALAGDPESAFGGVLACSAPVDKATAEAINEIFFEVLIAPAYDKDALEVLRSKKNRIVLRQKVQLANRPQYRRLLNGVLQQQQDEGNYLEWKEVGGRPSTSGEKDDLTFANIVCKHLKSNAIALVKDRQLIGKGCGQTSRVDSVRQSIAKAAQFNFDLKGAVLASDAFFPFNDSVQIAHAAGITAFIQPGGSIRDKDSVDYCVENKLVMVLTGIRHFKH